MDFDRELDAIASYMKSGGKAVALTGAGISVDSGIPDFRSEGGLWARFDPMEYATIDAFRRDPKRVWEMVFELEETVLNARPNEAHYALAELEKRGLLEAVITQNIDGLHQLAGSREVIEFHGSAARLVCLRCESRVPAKEIARCPPEPPICRCGGIYKPDIVFFGEVIPPAAVAAASYWASHCRLMLIIGTSALVSPASEIPVAALGAGALLVEANLGPTPLSALCAHRIEGSAVTTLPALVAAL